ncbi:putative signal transducing protein [Fusibacter ferrireducens]|uniref:DUF2007 domain-containing protein n=1 Tax=Fusibacter ferrireducens TaxID=2785058 RepID=A0ABR9ZVD5_9FIRM|nr:DUF2007 domain-containing protein [Fusibacter ferrireducens]MBF4694388.1 DUF2007 domain-containing protein [Fusibacter ferrireducens]
MVKIATVSDPIELEMLKELFADNGIEIMPQHREAGEFLTLYMGTSNYGIDIFVSEADEEAAKKLHTLYFSEIQTIDEASLMAQAEEAINPEDDFEDDFEDDPDPSED